jgi:undecaprenyl-diphosphatase
MEYLRIVVLGIVQGITEFLPISSDGHLVLGAAIFEAVTGKTLPDTLAVEIVLHAGTLAAILVVYWQRFWRLLGADRRVIGLLVVGTLPAVVVGLPLERYGKPLLESPLAAGVGLIITGAVLLWGTRRADGQREYQQLSLRDALLIGVFQAAAILPGVSRSGLTIACALAVGRLRPDASANFSFLLAIPAIGGAVTLQMVKLAKNGTGGTSAGELVLGAGVAFVVGLAALWWLLDLLRKGKLHYFAWWCIPVGMAAIAWRVWAAL